MRRQCRKCKRVLEVGSLNFDENKNSTTGYQSTCKRCSKNVIRINRISNNTTKYPLDYDMHKAHHEVQKAIRKGILLSVKNFNCDVCLTKRAVEYHHWSYLPENRLSVIPMCKSCHSRLTNIVKHTPPSKQIDTPTHVNTAIENHYNPPLLALS